jgi:hypothetical protein
VAGRAKELKRDAIWLNRHPAFSFLFEHDLFGKPVSTFPDHALAFAQFLNNTANEKCPA